MTPALRDLIAAFRAAEPKIRDGDVSQLAVLVSDDPDEGMDVEAIRVLGAWLYAEHKWKEPPKPCPDGGRPTPKAYRWMMSGAEFDYADIADRANVTRTVARQKLALLLGARMIYADGTIAGAAKAAMEATIARRVRAKPNKQQAQGQPPGAKTN